MAVVFAEAIIPIPGVVQVNTKVSPDSGPLVCLFLTREIGLEALKVDESTDYLVALLKAPFLRGE